MEQRNLLSAGQPVKETGSVYDLTAGQVRDLLRARPQRPAGVRSSAGRGDHTLNPGMTPPALLKPAAVLVPVVDRPGGLTVLFTQRTANLAAHAGQVSFPGGRIEATDLDATAAALRETEEEIGLSRERVELIGTLDRYVTRTGFQIMPFVGIVHPPFELTADPNEVAEIFEVPFAFLLDPASAERHSREFGGARREFYAFPYGPHYIWGATAGMLINLCEILRGE